MLREVHVSNFLLQNVNKIFHLPSFGKYTVKHLKEVQRFWLDKWFENHDTVLKKIANMQIMVSVTLNTPKIKEYNSELYDRPNRPETIETQPEAEVDTDEKGPHILQSEVEKAIKEMRNRKAIRDDDIPGDVLKLLGEGGLKILTKLSNTIYNTGEWPQDFTEVTMIALKKKTKATKCSDYA